MSQTQLTVPVRDGYDFGVGADLLSGAPMNKSVNSDAVKGVESAQGATVNFVVQRVQTTHDLEQTLGISAEASYGCPSFGAGISARFDFAKGAKIQSSSLFMAITVTVKLKVLSIEEPALTPEASKLVDRPDIFAQRFGNVFVHSMERGGLFIGILRVDTSSSEESENIDTQLKGSYGLFSASAEVKFSEVEKNYKTDVFVQMYHEGGPVDLVINDPANPLELLRNANLFLQSFSTDPDKVAVPYLVTLAPISIATGPLPLNESDLAHAQDVMRFCAERRSLLLDQLNLLQLIVDRPFRFDFSNGADLKAIGAAAADTQADLDLIASCASAAIDSPASAKLPADFARAGGKTFPTAVMPAILPQAKPSNALAILAAKGRLVTAGDPLLTAMRLLEPEGPDQLGFDIGVGLADNDTLWGPGKQGIIDSLKPIDPAASIVFASAASAEASAHFIVDRNANADFASRGAAIAKAEKRPEVLAARNAQRAGYYTLGFDIAAGIFGNGTLGGAGHTLQGPGSNAIRASLPQLGISGYDRAVAIYIGQ